MSLPATTVLREVHAALRGGSQEIVLCGVHLGSWGKDLSRSSSLQDLIHILLKKTGIHACGCPLLSPGT